ncbi:MAG TPA: electron transfer flavoprotein subunit alpha/FixB family protein, partial [Chitinophagaceae bacterium]|nr:electron transfer flavoprotein subunit alpha/FixB family protein [Chitinophagaceae bacterium]
MSVLIFIDHVSGQIKKASLEALSYGAALAEQTGTTAEGFLFGTVTDDLSSLGQYGITKVHQVQHENVAHFDSQVYTKVAAELATQTGAQVLIFSNNTAGKAIAPRLSVRLKAGLVAGAVGLPDTKSGFVVKKAVFSGKAFAQVAVNTPVKIISLNVNSFQIKNEGSQAAEVVPFNTTIEPSKLKITGTTKTSSKVALSEAETVVSAGRGLKGPENWAMVEELATLLGAGLACSRPVADAHWRPHTEHVGQTGVAI